MKRVISMVIVFVVLIAAVVPASAASYPQIQPRYTYVSSVHASLSINTTTGVATCTGGVTAKNIQPVKVVVYLQQDMGSYWKTLDSWTGTGTMDIEITNRYAVYSGDTYRVYAVGYVYDSNNNLLESASADHEVYYP